MLPQIYKFKEIVDPGDESLRYVVLEDRKDWVLVKEVTLFNDWPIPPTHEYRKSDLEVIDAEERKNWERVYEQVVSRKALIDSFR